MTYSSLLLDKIVQTADDNKAQNITVYDVKPESIIADYIVVLTVNNMIHCKSLSELIDRDVRAFLKSTPDDDYSLPRLSGASDSGWIVMDINSIIVHVMVDDVREFYQLDQLLEKRGTVYHH